MKKIIAFILAMLIFSLSACTVKQVAIDPTPSTPQVTESINIISAAPTPTETIPPDYKPADYIGFFDPYYDYASAPRYKVQYMVLANGGLFELFDKAFAHWASKMNLDYGGLWETGGDKDAFYNQIPEFVAQGVNGFLLDADPNMYPRMNEMLTELGTPWMSGYTAARIIGQESGPLLHPYIKVDNYAFGVHLTEKLIELKDVRWPNVSYEEIGLITEDDFIYRQSPPLSDRQRGIYDAWIEKTGLEDHYFLRSKMLNRGSSMDNYQTPYRIKAIISENPEIKYWLIAAPYSLVAKSTADMLDTLHLADTVCIVSTSVLDSIDPPQIQWDSGEQNAWKEAEYIPETIYTEPIIGALYAFMSGQATPETIWPQWVNVNDCGGEGSTYASLMLPSYWIEYDNYKRVTKWSDVYAGSDFFPDYPTDGITPDSYNARAEVPAYYSVKAQDK